MRKQLPSIKIFKCLRRVFAFPHQNHGCAGFALCECRIFAKNKLCTKPDLSTSSGTLTLGNLP